MAADPSEPGQRLLTRLNAPQRFGVAGVVVILVVARKLSWTTLPVGRRQFHGRDVWLNLWVPLRELLAGHPAYGVPHALGTDVAPGLYGPWLLTLALPLACLSLATAVTIVDVLNLAWTWAALAMGVRRSGRASMVAPVAAVVGAVLLFTLASEDNLVYGQLGPLFGLCATVLVFADLERPGWGTAIALCMVCGKPQTMGPLVVLLLAAGLYRLVARAALVAAVLAAPVVRLVIRSEHGVVPTIDALRRHVRWYNALPDVSLVNSVRVTRIDLSTLTRILPQSTWEVSAGALQVGLLVAAAIALWRLKRRVGQLEPARLVPFVLAVTLLVSYHKSYDVTILLHPLLALALAGDVRLRPQATRLVFLALLLRRRTVDAICSWFGVHPFAGQSISNVLLCGLVVLAARAAARSLFRPAPEPVEERPGPDPVAVAA